MRPDSISHTLSRVKQSTGFILGHAVVLLVEELRYKPETRGFDSRWYHWNFSLA
jgi:hypothetical protein